ncbi:MAG TPA: hypothetical protein VMC79_02790, partial [Rectinemataceae bacterium]|nr:hypothetical protein [Rectinemataceae bacterium]
LALINKSSLGNVEAAAQKKAGTATTEWWNAQPQTAAPAPAAATGSTADSNQVQAPAAPVPAPTTKK